MKRRGSIFVEVVVSILLFLVGILALTSTLMYGVKLVAESRTETAKEQEYRNRIENEVLGVIRSSSFVPSGSPILTDALTIKGKTLDFTLYRYEEEKKGTEIYLLKRGSAP